MLDIANRRRFMRTVGIRTAGAAGVLTLAAAGPGHTRQPVRDTAHRSTTADRIDTVSQTRPLGRTIAIRGGRHVVATDNGGKPVSERSAGQTAHRLHS